MLEGIMAVALENRPRYRPLSRQAQELRDARVCYDHLAGRLSVDLADFFATPDGVDFWRVSGLIYLREQSVTISAARASIGQSVDHTLGVRSVRLSLTDYSICTGQKEKGTAAL
jgi:hypothetical protein